MAKDQREAPSIRWVRTRWLCGAGRLQFSASLQSGSGKTSQRLQVQVSHEELRDAAAALRDDPSAAHREYAVTIPRGRGQQVVKIPVSRDVLLAIADALAGAVDADDAGHRFYHWENPEAVRPCSRCREARDAEDARVDAARLAFLYDWSGKLGIPTSEIAALLAEYHLLPTKSLRR